MEPDKFRESRHAINRLCENLSLLIEQNAVDASRECCQKAQAQLDLLIPLADDEIQQRSVKNLGLKIKHLISLINKIKVKKIPASGAGKNEVIPVEWNEDRIKQLSPSFLKKVSANMQKDLNASVCFDITGKGVRPSYQIRFGNQETATFSGSAHKLKGNSLSGSPNKISRPFSRMVIDSALKDR
ncbi:MAG: hypothetical protein A2277_10955 [Desulfobacterales bacterium RIFOXYA12_FULL_46_15]|nr:MAG: hypothetical protein A2097_11175 [Desulfobacula sp. GWF2_41_7]OGR22406.1 MAG: hypothetical protein A2277_10955 [Desulfobacterales bacterium RIFOXYA12_FULL_46_15]